MTQTCQYWLSPYVNSVNLFKAAFTSFEYSKHWHDELAIGLIQQGAEGLKMAGETIIVPKGHIIAINPSEIHTGFGVDCDRWVYRMFYFDAEFVVAMADRLGIKYREFPYINQSVIHNKPLFELLFQLHIASEQSCLMLSYEVTLIKVFRLLFQYTGKAQLSNEKKLTKNDQKVIEMKRYLDRFWRDNVSLKELSKMSELSQYQVIRHFEKKYNISPHQYLIQKKLVEVKKRIAQGDSIINASTECGFYDQSHMTRNFKRSFALTPRQIAT